MNIQQERITVGSSDFTLTEKLGEGAEGAIYRLPSSNEVVKIFEKEKREEKSEKVQAMIANNPTDPTYQQSNSDIRSIVWPTAIVEHPDKGDFLGYTMAYKNLADHKNACRYARENLQWNTSDPEDRYKTALNLVRVVRAIHEQGHAIGDLNHQNILIDSGYVSVIDCDGFHISSNQKSSTYPGETFFPRYAPPEGRANTTRGVKLGDRFGIAVHIFQLLMEGFHPFQGQGPNAAGGTFADMIEQNEFIYASPRLSPHTQAPDYEQLPAGIKNLFSKCFDTAKRDPKNRPETDEWSHVLKDITSTRRTKKSMGGSSGQPTQSGATSKTGSMNGSTSPKPSQTQDISIKDQKPQSRKLLEIVTSELKRTLMYIGGLFLILLIGVMLFIM